MDDSVDNWVSRGELVGMTGGCAPEPCYCGRFLIVLCTVLRTARPCD